MPGALISGYSACGRLAPAPANAFLRELQRPRRRREPCDSQELINNLSFSRAAYKIKIERSNELFSPRLRKEVLIERVDSAAFLINVILLKLTTLKGSSYCTGGMNARTRG
jgi:hypothetical protein